MSINSRRKTIDGEERPLQDYEGNVLLIVNTASKCGFTPQKNSLHELYEEIGKGEFETLGFHVINSMVKIRAATRRLRIFVQKR